MFLKLCIACLGLVLLVTGIESGIPEALREQTVVRRANEKTPESIAVANTENREATEHIKFAVGWFGNQRVQGKSTMRGKNPPSKVIKSTLTVKGSLSAKAHGVASPCVGDIIDKFKAEFPTRPRVALIIAERINRIPARLTERMDRFGSALQGSDMFVAIEPEDLEYVHFLKPVPLKVGLFNRTWPVTFSDAARSSKLGGGLLQLLKTRDAFNLIRQQEAEQGWKYDVVVRLRLESVQSDICTMGLHKGCMAPGAWSYAIAAHVLQGERKTIFHAHDRAFLGSRDDMEELFNAYMKAVDARGSILTRTRYKANTCEEGGKLFGAASRIKSVCKQGVDMEVQLDHTESRAGETLLEDTMSFQDRILIESGFRASDKPGPLAGFEIRRYSYDYPSEAHGDHQVNKHGLPNPHGYASGCAPYPVVGDRKVVVSSHGA